MSKYNRVFAIIMLIILVMAMFAFNQSGVTYAAPPGKATNTPTFVPGTSTPPPAGSPITIYGAWHCGNDSCTWGTVRDMTDFDTKNHWLIDRGDGSGLPSVNLVILAFVDPLKLLNKTNDAQTVNGV